MDDRFLQNGFDKCLAHVIEEMGEALSAAGKTQRWGRDSVNPLVPSDQQETNEAWLRRELEDVKVAISRLELAAGWTKPPVAQQVEPAAHNGLVAGSSPAGRTRRVYLAARYSRAEELRAVRDALTAAGFEVTSRWIDGGHELTKEGSTQADEVERTRFALEDFGDLMRADTCISFTEEPRTTKTRGGRHVEFGAALALGKRTIVVGHRENVFHCLPEVEFYEAWPKAFAVLSAHQPPSEAAPVKMLVDADWLRRKADEEGDLCVEAGPDIMASAPAPAVQEKELSETALKAARNALAQERVKRLERLWRGDKTLGVASEYMADARVAVEAYFAALRTQGSE